MALALVVLASFSVLLWMGQQINQAKPPIPSKVVSTDGTVLMTGDDIMHGQQVWQSMGGQEMGSVWGHGAYVAPDWTADWLHREASTVLDGYARQIGGTSYDQLPVEQQAQAKARLKATIRTNTYDASTGTVKLVPERITAFESNARHYAELFSKGDEAAAIPAGALTDQAQLRQLSDFFWWTSWSASTNAPGDTVTYLQNWPHEPLIDNVPPPANILWSIISFVLLLGGIGGMVWYHQGFDHEDELTPELPPTIRSWATTRRPPSGPP